MDGYYHNNCYREQITQSLSMKKKMFGFLEKADKMLDNFDEKSGGKEYEIVT